MTDSLMASCSAESAGGPNSGAAGGALAVVAGSATLVGSKIVNATTRGTGRIRAGGGRPPRASRTLSCWQLHSSVRRISLCVAHVIP